MKEIEIEWGPGNRTYLEEKGPKLKEVVDDILQKGFSYDDGGALVFVPAHQVTLVRVRDK